MPVTVFTGAQGRAGTQTVTPWVELRVEPYGGGGAVVYKWARHDIADPVANFGELKEGRLVGFGRVRRALSDADGQYQAATFGWTVADVDGLLATLLESMNHRWLAQRSVEIKIIGSAGRAVVDEPLVLARGLVTRADPSGPRAFALDAEDVLSSEFGGLGLEATVPRRLIAATLFPDASPDVMGLPQPIIYGELTDAGAATPHGVVPTIPVGTETISTVSWMRLLVCGHACKAISQVYLNGTNVSARFGVDVLAPGQAGWPFGTAYRDIGGQRVTLLYVRDDARAAVEAGGLVSCNVQGAEAVGDGTGGLITLVAFQYEHFLINWVFQSYLTGAWLTRPYFVNPVITPNTYKVHATAFGELGSLHVDRQPGIGYAGGGIMGLGETISVRDAIASFNLSCDCQCGFDQAGQFFVTAEPVTLPTPTVGQTQEFDILRDSFGYRHDLDRFVNEQPYVYRRAYTEAHQSAGGLAWHQGSIDAYRGARRGEELVLDWIRDEQTANNLVQYRLLRTKDPQRLATWRTSLHGLSLELGQHLKLTHRFGTGAAGWMDRTLRLLELEVDVDALTVTCVGRDMQAAQTPGSVSFGAYHSRTDAPSLSLGSAGVAVSPSVVTVMQPQFCGGSRSQGVRSTTDTDVKEHVDVRVDWGALPVEINAHVDVEVWTRNVATTATPAMYDVTVPGSPAFVVGGTGTTALPTAPNRQTLIIVRPSGAGVKWYRLRIKGSNVTAEVHALGSLRLAT